MSGTPSEILSAPASLALADSYCVDEEYELAIDAYAAALSVLRDNERTVKFRALSHKASVLLQLRRFEEAIDDTQMALADLPEGLRNGETEICNHRLGLALLAVGRMEEAAGAFQQALQLAHLNKRSTAERYEMLLSQCKKELERNDDDDDDNDADEALVVEEVPSKKAAPTKPTTTAEATTTSASAPAPITAPSTSRPVPPPSSLSLSPRKPPTMPKYQYYQSDKVMTIAILETGVQPQELHVTFKPKRLTVRLTKQGKDFTVIAGKLYSEIDPLKSKTVIKDEKVLIKLRKTAAYEWHELMSKAKDDDDDDDDDANATTGRASNANAGGQGDATSGEATPATATAPASMASEIPMVEKGRPRAYASHRDWDAIERNIKADEEKEKPEGDEALNKLFQSIYGNADEDTRRAMIKSYQTSGGTVLSTNWNEVKQKDYEKEREAPKGMEWKTWEGEKVKGGDSNDDGGNKS